MDLTVILLVPKVVAFVLVGGWFWREYRRSKRALERDRERLRETLEKYGTGEPEE